MVNINDLSYFSKYIDCLHIKKHDDLYYFPKIHLSIKYHHVDFFAINCGRTRSYLNKGLLFTYNSSSHNTLLTSSLALFLLQQSSLYT